MKSARERPQKADVVGRQGEGEREERWIEEGGGQRVPGNRGSRTSTIAQCLGKSKLSYSWAISNSVFSMFCIIKMPIEKQKKKINVTGARMRLRLLLTLLHACVCVYFFFFDYCHFFFNITLGRYCDMLLGSPIAEPLWAIFLLCISRNWYFFLFYFWILNFGFWPLASLVEFLILYWFLFAFRWHCGH